MNINSVINQGSKILKSKLSPHAQLDAEILMAKTINKNRKYILLNYKVFRVCLETIQAQFLCRMILY